MRIIYNKLLIQEMVRTTQYREQSIEVWDNMKDF